MQDLQILRLPLLTLNLILLVGCFAALYLLETASIHSAEPSPREAKAIEEAKRRSHREDWPGAGDAWEQAMLFAEEGGDYDRAITHGELALAVWRKTWVG